MRKYLNYASKFRFVIVFSHIVFISGIVLSLLYDSDYDTSGFITMCVGILLVLTLEDVYFFGWNYIFNITKYDDIKIVNRFIFKKKELYYKDIKQVVLCGTYLVLMNESIGFSEFYLNRKKYFKKYFTLDVGNDDRLLINISQNICILYIIGHSKYKRKYFENFFKVEEIDIKSIK